MEMPDGSAAIACRDRGGRLLHDGGLLLQLRRRHPSRASLGRYRARQGRDDREWLHAAPFSLADTWLGNPRPSRRWVGCRPLARPHLEAPPPRHARCAVATAVGGDGDGACASSTARSAPRLLPFAGHKAPRAFCTETRLRPAGMGIDPGTISTRWSRRRSCQELVGIAACVKVMKAEHAHPLPPALRPPARRKGHHHGHRPVRVAVLATIRRRHQLAAWTVLPKHVALTVFPTPSRARTVCRACCAPSISSAPCAERNAFLKSPARRLPKICSLSSHRRCATTSIALVAARERGITGLRHRSSGETPHRAHLTLNLGPLPQHPRASTAHAHRRLADDARHRARGQDARVSVLGKLGGKTATICKAFA